MQNVKIMIDKCVNVKLLTNLQRSYEILDAHWNQLNKSIEKIIDDQDTVLTDGFNFTTAKTKATRFNYLFVML